jgi:hypothetical protein
MILVRSESNARAAREMEIIVNCWEDSFLDYLIYQQPEYRHVMENIYKKLDKSKHIVLNDLLYFTKPFNNIIYEKYGFHILLEGLKNIIRCNFNGQIHISNTIKKGYLNEKNRKKIISELNNC